MYSTLLKGEIENRRWGFLTSIVFHILLLMGIVLVKCSMDMPPPPDEQGGILVNLGKPDQGQGDENAPEGEPAPPAKEPEPEKETPTPVKEKEQPKKEPVKTKPDPEPKKDVVKTEDPDAIALKKQKEAEKKRKDAEEQVRQDEVRKQKEASDKAEAARKAEADRQKALKDQIGGALGGGKGKGKGDTGKPGNQGDPNGDPNSNILTGISTGSGVVGGGLGNRGVVNKGGTITYNTAEEGVVMLEVCIDSKGSVVSAEFTQRGSTTTSTTLKNLAIANAKKWKFKSGDVDKQCGTIKYDFRQK